MELIDKSALVAEIKRHIPQRTSHFGSGTLQSEYIFGQITAYNTILSLLDTLEVKEVKEAYLDEYVDSILEEYDCSYDKIDLYDFAKHFFELGLKTQK